MSDALADRLIWLGAGLFFGGFAGAGFTLWAVQIVLDALRKEDAK